MMQGVAVLLAVVAIPTVAFSQTAEAPVPPPTPEPAKTEPAKTERSTFSLKPGEALIISPQGAVEFVSRLRGDPGNIREMRRRSKPLKKGVMIWADLDGSVSMTEPIDAKSVKESKPKPRVTEKPEQDGARCNIKLCASTFASFHASDCTYQPHGGGPRRLCEFGSR